MTFQEFIDKYIDKQLILCQILPLISYYGVFILSKKKKDIKVMPYLKYFILATLVIFWSFIALSVLYPVPNYYQEAMIKRNFNRRDIKTATKMIYKNYHPDRHREQHRKDEQQVIFTDKLAAIDLLQNSIKRDIFDRFGLDYKSKSNQSDMMQLSYSNIVMNHLLHIFWNNLMSFNFVMCSILLKGIISKKCLEFLIFKVVFDAYYYGIKHSVDFDILDLIFPSYPLHQRKVVIDLISLVYLCHIVFQMISTSDDTKTLQKLDIPADFINHQSNKESKAIQKELEELSQLIEKEEYEPLFKKEEQATQLYEKNLTLINQ